RSTWPQEERLLRARLLLARRCAANVAAARIDRLEPSIYTPARSLVAATVLFPLRNGQLMNPPPEPRPTLWQRLAAALQGGLVLAFLSIWTSNALHGQFWRADFTAFYLGWRIVLEGHGDLLYDRSLQEEYQARYVPERTEEGGLL